MANYQRPSRDVSRYCEKRGFSRFVCEGGFDYLLDRWTGIVAEIETGYRGLFCEFLNDMDARAIIHELATYASEKEAEKVEALLPSLDERFKKSTRSVETCIWGEQNAAKHGYLADQDWWYYRVPKNLMHVKNDRNWG